MIFATGFSIFAQSEEIALPDVTTVVNGETFTAGKDSVPDYSAILPENDAPEVRLPEMEGVKKAENLPYEQEKSAQKEKDIYAEGELGAGYPFYFKGDFSIYRVSGDSPFQIDFSHESTEGFARKKANEGFFERNTAIHGKKSFSSEYSTHFGEAEYKMSDDGLQLNSDSYSDTMKHTILGKAGSDWETSGGFLISYGAEGAWFNRYGEVMKDSPTSGNFLDSTKIFDLNPYAGFGWTNDDFKVLLSVFYGLQANFNGKGNLIETEGSSNSGNSHRGEFKLSLSWANDFLSLGASGSLIVGTATGSKNLVPAFTLFSEYKTDEFDFTDGRDFTVSLQGGIDSYQEKIRNLENKYKFAVSPSIPTETTDAFAKIEASVPLLEFFEAKSTFEFRKTIFGNGIWAANYENSSLVPILDANGTHNSGLYAITTDERTEFNTDFGFYADFSPFKAGAEWKSYWVDVPSLEEKQKIKLLFEYQKENAKWNAGTSTTFAFGGDADSCPDISAWAGVRLASSLSLAFEVNDVIKLLHGTSRDYAHSEYITTSGNAVLLAKFQF